MGVRMMTMWKRKVPFAFPTDDLNDQAMGEIAEELEIAVPVDAQNVFSVYRESGLPESVLDVAVMSPWPKAFIEYSLTDSAHVGVLLHMAETQEGTPAYESGARYVHAALIFTENGDGVHAFSRGGFCNDASGRLLMRDELSWSLPFATTIDLVGGDAAHKATQDVLSMIVHTLIFANCKNVQAVEEENLYPTRQARRAAERRGDPKPPRFYTLRINPNATRKQGAGTGTSGRELSLHIVRGHFATYTEERKLFGKHAGTFWIPAHVRGSDEVGIVGKDYAIDVNR